MLDRSSAVQEPRQQESARARQELRQVTDSSNDVLASITTVFPFTLFPDTVTVDRTQVTITHRTFIMTGGVTSVRIEDILNVTAEVGLFFGSLKVSTRFFDPDKPYQVNYFWRNDALKLKAIIHGLVIAAKKEIDISMLGKRELMQELITLGQSAPDEAP